MWDLTTHPPLGLSELHSRLQPMWDLTIHSPLEPSFLAGTRSLFQSMWDLPIHSPLEPSVLASTRSFLQSMWDHSIHPLSRSSVLAGTSPHVHPLRGSTSLLAHRPVPDSDTICNSPSLPLEDIVLLDFFFQASSQGFKMHLIGRGFHTLIKNAAFSSPTDVRSHNPPLLRPNELRSLPKLI